jgi:hypothetical protein
MRVTHRAAETVGAPGTSSYAQAQSVVAGASSLSDAVEQGNFLGPMTEAEQAEVRAVLEAIPAEVDAAFMDSLRAALANGDTIAFVWNAHPEGGFDHNSSTDSEGTIVLELRTPPGNTFTQT